MAVADKPILLPDVFSGLQDTLDGIQREILIPMEVLSIDATTGYAVARITLEDYANDSAADAGGVPVGGIYRNGSQLMVRVS